MCGIIGYVGKNQHALSVVIDGLERLEYRGYDSAGVAYIHDGALNVVKSTGQISELRKKLDLSVDSNMAIGHTRWATHGVPDEVNSHPHTVASVTVVHNGIIENYLELKNELVNRGVSFKSETDTEVAAALLDYYYHETNDFIESIRMFKKRVKGSYAIVVIVDGINDKLFVIKNLSPLIIGVGNDENFIASDVPAILNNTDKYINLLDMEYAVVEANSVTLYDKDDLVKDYKVQNFSGDATLIDKGEYEHFMLKEIHEEPLVVRNLFKMYLKDELMKLPDLCKYKSVSIVACGSAMHAGLVGKYFIENNLNIPVSVYIASEFRYQKLFIGKNDVVIAISQSGETADTLAAVKIAKKLGAHTVGIVNVKESSIAREVDEVIYTHAGSEISVATTKAYIAQLVVLFLISLRNSDMDMSAFDSVPVLIEKLINDDELYLRIASEIKDHEDIFFIGRQIDYALCMEGSLKLKEISYIHSDAYAAGELKHGTISLVSDGTPIFAVLTEASIQEKTISNIKEVKARGAKVILVVSEDLFIEGDYYDEVIIIPKTNALVSSILAVVPLQLVAYHVARLRGCSIDKPKNLAKSVTVE